MAPDTDSSQLSVKRIQLSVIMLSSAAEQDTTFASINETTDNVPL